MDLPVYHRVLRIACSSSHILVHTISHGRVLAITFPTEKDPLETNLTTSKQTEEAIESAITSPFLVTTEKRIGFS